MENRLAPLLAVAYMDMIEQHGIRDIVLYKRYIDDILVVEKAGEAVIELFMKLHKENIKLTRSTKDYEGWQLEYCSEIIMGSSEVKLYRRPSNRDIIIKYHSAHP